MVVVWSGGAPWTDGVKKKKKKSKALVVGGEEGESQIMGAGDSSPRLIYSPAWRWI